MENSTLIYKNNLQVLGESLEVQVFSRQDGRHFARTVFGPSDQIIIDGASPREVLEKHCDALALALHFRRFPSA